MFHRHNKTLRLLAFHLFQVKCKFKSQNFSYASPEEEKIAAIELAKEVKQIDEHNQEYLAGKSTFYEAPNELSDIPTDQFEKDFEGLLNYPPG